MKILVTEGTGFAGAALAQRLVELRHEVVSLDFLSGLRKNELQDMCTDMVRGSVIDPNAVDRCMDGVGVALHVATAFHGA